MQIPRDRLGAPYTTLVDKFLRDTENERMSSSRTGPSWTQLILPGFLHIHLGHVTINASNVWKLRYLPPSLQWSTLGVLILGSMLVKRIDWALARRTVHKLPVDEQNPVAIHKLMRELTLDRSRAWATFKSALCRGRIRLAWTSFRHFVNLSTRFADLNDLRTSIGTSSGMSVISGLIAGLTRWPGPRSTLIEGILYPIAIELSQASAVGFVNISITKHVLDQFQDAAITDYPSLQWLLRPNYSPSFLIVNAMRIVQRDLALSPHAGNTVHLLGSVLGFLSGSAATIVIAQS